jgi:hypothetical protein
MNKNMSYKDRCGIYRITTAELVAAKPNSGKNDYIRISLKKVMKSGRLQLGFSHYFNLGIKEYVDEYKHMGVTDKGISQEDLEKLKEAYEKGETDAQYEFYGFWWTQEFGAVYRNKETGKIASETLVFIPCDEDTGLPLPEFVMTAARLDEILKGYELVKQDTAEQGASVNDEDQNDEDERAAFEEYMRQKKQQG